MDGMKSNSIKKIYFFQSKLNKNRKYDYELPNFY